MSGPVSSAPPVVAVVVQQGRQLTGAVGIVVRLRRDQVRLPVVPLRHGRCALQVDPRRDEPHLHARREGRGEDARLRGARDRQDGNDERVREPRRTGRGTDAKLVSTGQPTITGVPKEGQTLQVSAGSWSPTPATVGYQWQRCNPNGRLCTPLPGATASTYAVTAADTGHALLAVVHATVGAASQDAISVATPAAVIAQTTGPSSYGAADGGRDEPAGQAAHGLDRNLVGLGRDRLRLSVVPLRRGGRALQVGPRRHEADLHARRARTSGQTLGFAVHATDATGTATAYASLVGPVAAAGATLVSTAQPTIAGVARQGQTLQVSDGSWNRTPASLTYAWQRCNPNGRLCIPIAGATAATYAVTAADAGHALLALVQARANGVSQATLSVATAVVS